MTVRTPPRAAPLVDEREDTRAPERTRSRTRIGSIDPFHIDPGLIPDGMSVEWKRASVFGKGEDQYMATMQDNGWLPVPTKLIPGLMGAGTGPNEPVTRDGMILCERPKHLTDEARREHKMDSERQVANNREQLREAVHNIGDDGPRVPSRVGREFASVDVPE